MQTPSGLEAADAALDWLTRSLRWQATLHMLEHTALVGTVEVPELRGEGDGLP